MNARTTQLIVDAMRAVATAETMTEGYHNADKVLQERVVDLLRRCSEDLARLFVEETAK